MFSHPGSVHPVNHLRVGVAHLLRDEVWVSTVSQRLTCIRVSGLVCSAITNPVASHYCLLRRVERPDCVMLPSMGNHCSRFKDYILPGQRNKLAGDIYFFVFGTSRHSRTRLFLFELFNALVESYVVIHTLAVFLLRTVWRQVEIPLSTSQLFLRARAIVLGRNPVIFLQVSLPSPNY